MEGRNVLAGCDGELAALKSANPGWNIWFVPHTQPGGELRIVWCAQPKPLLNCHTPAELTAQMRAADQRWAGPPREGAR